MMTILVYGGDARQQYAGEELTRLGYSVRYIPAPADETADCLCGADILLLPIPATRDGIHLNTGGNDPPPLTSVTERGPARIFGGGFSSAFVSRMRHTGREVTDLLTISAFTEENAALTAEAALGVGMQAAGISLRALPVGVIGYGRIAARLTRLLLLLGARVRVFARREEARLSAALDGAEPYDTAALRLHLASCRLVYNTVPAPLLDTHVTGTLHHCALVELASGRENIDLRNPPPGVTLHFAHSLPGKIFPVSAGKIIARTLDQTMQKEGFIHT